MIGGFFVCYHKMSNNSSSSSSSSSSAQSEHSQDSIDLDELPVVEVHEDEKNKEIDNKSTDLPHTGGITLDQLPDEIILKICRFLNTASFGKLSLASKRFVPICTSRCSFLTSFNS
jgi:hypothetical protein